MVTDFLKFQLTEKAACLHPETSSYAIELVVVSHYCQETDSYVVPKQLATVEQYWE